MIVAQNLIKRFGDQLVLKDLNLEIVDGETMVVMGRSGCGKSVFLKIIIGLLRPDSGTVLVDGRDVTKVRYKELKEVRKRFGMVFQGAALFDSLTVQENVGLALRKHTRLPEVAVMDRIEECLRMVELEGTEDKYPAELSGGMQKRVGLARAIAMNPQYILYDEPTSGLDPITARSINKLIVDLQSRLSTTSIVVTHDIDSAFYVGDRVAMLYDGVIRFVGTAEAFRTVEDEIIRQFIDRSE